MATVKNHMSTLVLHVHTWPAIHIPRHTHRISICVLGGIHDKEGVNEMRVDICEGSM